MLAAFFDRKNYFAISNSSSQYIGERERGGGLQCKYIFIAFLLMLQFSTCENTHVLLLHLQSCLLAGLYELNCYCCTSTIVTMQWDCEMCHASARFWNVHAGFLLILQNSTRELCSLVLKISIINCTDQSIQFPAHY